MILVTTPIIEVSEIGRSNKTRKYAKRKMS